MDKKEKKGNIIRQKNQKHKKKISRNSKNFGQKFSFWGQSILEKEFTKFRATKESRVSVAKMAFPVPFALVKLGIKGHQAAEEFLANGANPGQMEAQKANQVN
jgi:hypothetical protein